MKIPEYFTFRKCVVSQNFNMDNERDHYIDYTQSHPEQNAVPSVSFSGILSK